MHWNGTQNRIVVILNCDFKTFRYLGNSKLFISLFRGKCWICACSRNLLLLNLFNAKVSTFTSTNPDRHHSRRKYFRHHCCHCHSLTIIIDHHLSSSSSSMIITDYHHWSLIIIIDHDLEVWRSKASSLEKFLHAAHHSLSLGDIYLKMIIIIILMITVTYMLLGWW